MANSILELTEKIYNEGIAKANKEAELILAEAKKEAEDIVQAANQEKNKILQMANVEAEEISRKTHSEIRLAVQKLMSNLKQNIAETLISKQLDTYATQAFNDEIFIKEIIKTVVQNWVKSENEESELSLLVAPKDEAKIAEFFNSKLVHELSQGISISPDPSVRNGFKIGPKNGNYLISFTEKDFENYFRNYLKNKTWNLIFGPPQED